MPAATPLTSSNAGASTASTEPNSRCSTSNLGAVRGHQHHACQPGPAGRRPPKLRPPRCGVRRAPARLHPGPRPGPRPGRRASRRSGSCPATTKPIAERRARQQGVRQGISREAHAAQREPHADRAAAQAQCDAGHYRTRRMKPNSTRGKKPSCSVMRPLTRASDRRRRPPGPRAPSSGRRPPDGGGSAPARSAPQATGPPASRSVRGRWRRTRARSCSTTMITVRPSSCQWCNTSIKASVVGSSKALKGSSSSSTGASRSQARGKQHAAELPRRTRPRGAFERCGLQAHPMQDVVDGRVIGRQVGARPRRRCAATRPRDRKSAHAQGQRAVHPRGLRQVDDLLWTQALPDDAAGARPQLPRETQQQAALACPVGPHDGQQLAACDVAGESVHNGFALPGQAHILQPQQRGGIGPARDSPRSWRRQGPGHQPPEQQPQGQRAGQALRPRSCGSGCSQGAKAFSWFNDNAFSLSSHTTAMPSSEPSPGQIDSTA